MAREIDENPDEKRVAFENGMPTTVVECTECGELMKVADREDHDCE